MWRWKCFEKSILRMCILVIHRLTESSKKFAWWIGDMSGRDSICLRSILGEATSGVIPTWNISSSFCVSWFSRVLEWYIRAESFSASSHQSINLSQEEGIRASFMYNVSPPNNICAIFFRYIGIGDTATAPSKRLCIDEMALYLVDREVCWPMRILRIASDWLPVCSLLFSQMKVIVLFEMPAFAFLLFRWHHKNLNSQ